MSSYKELLGEVVMVIANMGGEEFGVGRFKEMSVVTHKTIDGGYTLDADYFVISNFRSVSVPNFADIIKDINKNRVPVVKLSPMVTPLKTLETRGAVLFPISDEIVKAMEYQD